MRHRHFSNSFTRPGIEQHDNNHTPVEQPYFPPGRAVAPENGPYVGQMNHVSRGGVHSGSHPNLANEYPSSNVNMERQSYAPTFSGSNVDQYSHSSITENRSLAPVPPVGQHVHCTNYNTPSIRDVESGQLNCPSDNRGQLKRKRSGMYSAGSSSSSSQMPIEKPSVDCESIPPYRGGPTIGGGEDSPRNVRRRYRLDLEPSRTHVPNHSSHFYQSTLHPPNYAAPIQHPNLDANGGQWNCVPNYAPSSHRRISPSDISGSRHEMNQFHVGASSSSQNLHGYGNHSRRVQSSYGNGSRNSRHCSPGGWRSSYRNGRPRVAVERLHSVIDVTESHDRTGHETIMMVDRASFFGGSRNFSDQYRDLRLDIDNMTYEELLNLEERIGNVNTGLSEDTMSKCLKEKVYHSSDQNHEEVSCPICLEEYKNGDKIGTMVKCRHDYHVDCIKKWLLMKKLCPICKSECSNQDPTEG